MIPETPARDAWGYVLGSLAGCLLWGLIFRLRPDLRRRMLWVSLLLLPLAPLGESFFLLDYWRPPLILPIWYHGMAYGGLADLLFVFALGGIATAAYPVVTHRVARRAMWPRRWWLSLAFIVIMAGCLYFLSFAVNSIFASMLGLLLTAVILCAFRPDLWPSALISGGVSALALTAVEATFSLLAPQFLRRYWLLYHTPWGILIAGHVPLTEMLWGAAFGAAIGPLYDACVGSDPARPLRSPGAATDHQ
ncbi:MAG: hypothetical protein ACHP7E_05595 [Burkholderiales bacterium]|jgi:hypothetical protein